MANKETQNFYLSNDQFDHLVNALQDGDESLFEKVFLSHFEDCLNYIRRKCNLSHEMAYDITMDTLIKFRSFCIQGKLKYGNLRFVFTQMAYQHFIKLNTENNKKANLKERVLEDDINIKDVNALEKALELISSNCQQLLKDFYFSKISLTDLANETGEGSSTLRKRKQRCIDKLRIQFQKYHYEGI